MAREKGPTRSRARTALRVFGILHLIFAGTGLIIIGHAVFRRISAGLAEFEFGSAHTPYTTEAWFLRTGINLIFLLLLAAAGILLVRLRIQGVRLSNVIFVTMIIYVLAPWALLLSDPLEKSMGATAGTGDMGINLQILTGYPVIALIGLNLARRKLPREPVSESAQALGGLQERGP
jgi:hypothetical protein